MEKNSELAKIYKNRMARNLIYMSYKTAEIEVPLNCFEISTLTDHLGPVPPSWNEGLFRYLDECINLLNTVEMCILSTHPIDEKNKLSALLILCHQIKGHATSIRILCSNGLDSQSRIIVRALYENCIAFCRALIDKKFRDSFREVETAEQSNEFWHKFISRSKSENYLIDYNKNNKNKCPLVISEEVSFIYKNLGISAHPNYLFSVHHYAKNYRLGPNTGQFVNGPELASEFVLSGSCHIILSTINFLGTTSNCCIKTAPWGIKGSIFDNITTNTDLFFTLGKISTLMSLMLMKWTNRQMQDFDPKVHF